jgi:hypothetical protein
MVRHIVLFQLKDDPRKGEVMNAFKNAIEALPSKLDIIRSISVSFNINTDEAYDIALVSEFDSLEDVKKYAVSPDHVAAGKLLAELKVSRACVDYEL